MYFPSYYELYRDYSLIPFCCIIGIYYFIEFLFGSVPWYKVVTKFFTVLSISIIIIDIIYVIYIQYSTLSWKEIGGLIVAMSLCGLAFYENITK